MRRQSIPNNKGRANHQIITATNKAQELERLAELGRLSSSLLHEISNPITSALLYLEQYKDQPAAAVRKVHGSVRAMGRYVEAARQQIRNESTPVLFAIKPQIKQLQRIVMPLAKEAGVQLSLEAKTDCQIFGDPVKFQQILANLIVNAIESYANPEASDLHKSVHVLCAVDQDNLYLAVSDVGRGISPMEMKQIFRPFYTTKGKAGHGLGIGLATVRQHVVNEFGGSISVKSSGRQGTVFTVTIPLNGGM